MVGVSGTQLVSFFNANAAIALSQITSGLGAGVATFLGTPSSANLLAALTTKTGTGLAVFGTSPTLITPALGTPSAVVLTNGTGLQISGITGLGTGVGTALALNVGSAGAPVTFGGAGGTPSSINLTNASALPNSALTATIKATSISFVIDGGGAAITTGVVGDLLVPYACTISKATLQADQSGSIVVDIWKLAFATSTPPTVANTITASALPTLSSAQSKQDTTLTGWTTSVSANDQFRFNVNSATTVQRVTLSLECDKT